MRSHWLFLLFASTLCGSSFGSLYCPDEKAVIVKGISCCLERVSKETCERLVKTHFDARLLDLVAAVQSDIAANKYGYKNAPNCHWTGISFHDLDEAKNPRLLNFPELEAILADGYRQVEKIRTGDLVVFDEVGKEAIFDDRDGQPKRGWYSYRHANHTAVFLEGDLIFQKQDNNSALFSIDTIGHVKDVYHSLLNAKPLRRQGVLQAKFYRRR